MTRKDVIRDGFCSGAGRFYTVAGHVERVEGSRLRDAFLPKLTREANKFIRDNGEFVRGQLKHYGVTFDEREFTGTGTTLLKKTLGAGKCDQVPPHIIKLEKEMHAQWLGQMTPEELSDHPDWIMERYFLTSGEPDRTKTKTVVGIPLDTYSQYRARQVREAADKIAGLHHMTGHGPKTQTIFLGWNQNTVNKAAKEHEAKETKAVKAMEKERDDERAELHNDYLKTLKRKKGSRAYSPVGEYLIVCAEVEREWPDKAEDMGIDIRATKDPGVFEATFDLGILEGVMIMCADKKKLEEYCSRLDTRYGGSREDEDESEEDYDEDEDEDEDEVKTSSKRKATSSAPRGRGRPAKKSKASASGSGSRKFYIKLRCSETGEGEIYSTPENGTITFQGENMAKFSAVASLPCVGDAVPFTGRKISDEVDSHRKSLSDYSDHAYEIARVSRWH